MEAERTNVPSDKDPLRGPGRGADLSSDHDY